MSVWQRDGDSIVWANVIDSVQTTLGLVSSIVWLVGEYWHHNDQPALVRLQFAFSVLYIAALLAQFCSAGIRKNREEWLAFDTVTSLPILYQAYQLGYFSGDDPGWITFLKALEVPLQWLVVLRFLRIIRLFKRTTLRSGALVITSDLVRSVTTLLFTVSCFIVIGGGLLHLIETSFPSGNHLGMWEALYTMFGVITVIGWGNAPHTVLGKVLDMLILMAALIVLPVQISNLVDSVSDYYKLGLAYSSRTPHVVMVVYPTMTSSDLASMLREFYSFHSGLSAYRCVLLGSGGESHRRSLLRYVAKSRYWWSVSYVVGSASSVSSLQKVAVERASAVFLLTSAWFVDLGQELADDEQSLLQAINIKQYCPSVPLILSLNKPRSRAHVLWFELCKFPNVQAVCLTEVKLQLLATQAMVPGLLGLIANLLQFGGRSATRPAPYWWHEWHQKFVSTKQLLSDPPLLGTWPLAFAVPPDRPVNTDIELSWEVQYVSGFLQELRSCPLPPGLSGLCFAEVAAALYERLLVVLLAVGRPHSRSGRVRVVLAPGYGEQLKVEQGDLLCLMVQSAEHARAVSEVHWHRETVRERWLRHRSQTASNTPLQFTSHGSPVSPAVPVDSSVASFYINAATSRQQPIVPDNATTKARHGTHSLRKQPLATGPTFSDDSVHVVELSSAPGQEMKRDDDNAAPMSDSTAKPVPGPSDAQRQQGCNAFSGHIVLCGFIDSRIVSFIRRFRSSDSRTVVLMLDNAVCYPLPAVTETFITANFKDVHVLYSSHTFKTRHQRARAYLSYSDCCFGHHHCGVSQPKSERRSKPSQRALASCVSSRGGTVHSERDAFIRPALPIDEVTVRDRKVADSLIQERRRRTQPQQAEADSDNKYARTRSQPSRYCRLRDDDPEPDVMDAQTVLQYANWYRRACVHSADMVFVLASSYIAPPDSTSSNGGTALNDDTIMHRSQVYLTSLFQSSQRSSSGAVKDEQIRADQHSLIMYAGIQTYLQQCSHYGCSLMAVRAKAPLVVTELLYQTNVRLLKQGTRGIALWQPNKPQPVGLRWLLQPFTRATDPRLTEPIQYRQAHDEDVNTRSQSSSPMSDDYRKALYTSDGLTMSSRLLDSLIVQAYVDPLVYETVCALGTAFRQAIPAADWRRILPFSLGAGSVVDNDEDDDDEEAKEKRTYRVELMLLDVPALLVGRSFGFMQLLMMVENGWVAMALYRDKRTLAAADSAASLADRGGSESSQFTEQSPFFVFTNPPPDTLLQRTDRIYALVQRWLSVDTAEAVLGQPEPAERNTAAGSSHGPHERSAPLTAPSVPSSYSPRVAPQRTTPAMPHWTVD